MKWYRFCTGAAIIGLLCIFSGVGLSVANQTMRAKVSERQQIINQGLMLSRVNAVLVNSLMTLAAKNNDEQLKKILADHGINLTSINPQMPSEK